MSDDCAPVVGYSRYTVDGDRVMEIRVWQPVPVKPDKFGRRWVRLYPDGSTKRISLTVGSVIVAHKRNERPKISPSNRAARDADTLVRP